MEWSRKGRIRKGKQKRNIRRVRDIDQFGKEKRSDGSFNSADSKKQAESERAAESERKCESGRISGTRKARIAHVKLY